MVLLIQKKEKEFMMVFNYTFVIYTECEYSHFLTRDKKKLKIQLDWRFRMILRLYIEVGWAVCQLIDVDWIWFHLLFAIFRFWYRIVDWRYIYIYIVSLYSLSFPCCWIVSRYSILKETFLVSFIILFSFFFPFSNSWYAIG